MFSLIKNISLPKLTSILFLIGFLTYLSSFANQFVWDDYHFFYQNFLTQDLLHIPQIFSSNTTAGAGVSSNYYRPLSTLSFALDHFLFGWNNSEMHIFNTLMHCLNGILLFLFLVLIRFGKVKSFLVSLVFLMHPIQTEAVTYLSSRGDILYLFFLFLSLLCFSITCYKKEIKILVGRKKIIISESILFFFSLLLFPLSILSKEGALTTVPIYAGVLMVCALQKKIRLKKFHETYKPQILIILLLILQTIVYLFLRITFLNFGNSLNYSGGNDLYSTHLWIRLLTFISAIPQYLRLLIIPYPLYLERSIPVVMSFTDLMFLFGVALIIGGLLLSSIEYRKKQTLWVLFGLIIIFANLLSVSGIIPQTALIRENWLYMPMIGFYIMSIRFLEIYLLPFIRSNQKTMTILFIIYSVVLIVMTMQQNYNWRNNIAYYEHNLQFTNSARLHLNVGFEYYKMGEYKKAEQHFKEGIKLDPTYPQLYFDLGLVYLRQKKIKQAEQAFIFSLEMDPKYLYSYTPLIAIYEYEKKYNKAVPYLEKLNLIYPNDLKLVLQYAQDLYLAKDKTQADNEFKHALLLSHNDPKLKQAIIQTEKIH